MRLAPSAKAHREHQQRHDGAVGGGAKRIAGHEPTTIRCEPATGGRLAAGVHAGAQRRPRPPVDGQPREHGGHDGDRQRRRHGQQPDEERRPPPAGPPQRPPVVIGPRC